MTFAIVLLLLALLLLGVLALTCDAATVALLVLTGGLCVWLDYRSGHRLAATANHLLAVIVGFAAARSVIAALAPRRRRFVSIPDRDRFVSTANTNRKIYHDL